MFGSEVGRTPAKVVRQSSEERFGSEVDASPDNTIKPNVKHSDKQTCIVGGRTPQVNAPKMCDRQRSGSSEDKFCFEGNRLQAKAIRQCSEERFGVGMDTAQAQTIPANLKQSSEERLGSEANEARAKTGISHAKPSQDQTAKPKARQPSVSSEERFSTVVGSQAKAARQCSEERFGSEVGGSLPKSASYARQSSEERCGSDGTAKRSGSQDNGARPHARQSSEERLVSDGTAKRSGSQAKVARQSSEERFGSDLGCSVGMIVEPPAKTSKETLAANRRSNPVQPDGRVDAMQLLPCTGDKVPGDMYGRSEEALTLPNEAQIQVGLASACKEYIQRSPARAHRRCEPSELQSTETAI
jgi:hypothetical protein